MDDLGIIFRLPAKILIPDFGEFLAPFLLS